MVCEYPPSPIQALRLQPKPLSKDEWVELNRRLSYLHEDFARLTYLIRETLTSYIHNVDDAIAIIQSCQPRRFNLFGRILVFPITFPVFFVKYLFKVPVKFTKWIIKNI